MASPKIVMHTCPPDMAIACLLLSRSRDCCRCKPLSAISCSHAVSAEPVTLVMMRWESKKKVGCKVILIFLLSPPWSATALGCQPSKKGCCKSRTFAVRARASAFTCAVDRPWCANSPGPQTGNTLKWSTQDYLASRKDYGLIRKESLNLHTRDGAGRPPLVDDDGIGFEVEYSINRKRRWLLAEELEAAETVIHEITERVYSPEPSRSPWLRMLTKYTYRAKSDEYVSRMCFHSYQIQASLHLRPSV